MGDKAEAIRTVRRRRARRSRERRRARSEDQRGVAERIGYPVLDQGLGGRRRRGMRIVTSRTSFAAARGSQQRGAGAFGVPDVYMEKVPRSAAPHRVQILGDTHGNLIHLFERECSIQRRHQKLLEESPSTALDAELRARMTEAALARRGAWSTSTREPSSSFSDVTGDFYFIEMNTRIQVEHPVTEMVTGIDLIKEQIRSRGGRADLVQPGRSQDPGALRSSAASRRDPDTFAP
jgi:acetyl-CoA carboxylase biotin carboxylase subunit